MNVAITGATGLLGANLAEACLLAGHTVTATRRSTSRVDHLRDLSITWVDATLGDPEALTRAFAGAEVVFHCAAAVTVRRQAEPWVVAANVDGTRHVIDAVKAAGVRRLVHCSSVVAVGLTDTGEPCDETAPWNFAEHGIMDGYTLTKRQAEEVVVAAVATEGLDAVIVNPTYMIGPRDVRPSSGRLLLEIVKRAVPGVSAGANNFVDVRDVARGMVAAAERGRTGERYILGGVDLAYADLFGLVAAVAEVAPITRVLPRWLANFGGWWGDLQEQLTDKEPMLNSASVAWGYTNRYRFTSAKAQAELGYTFGPLEPAIRDALEWFRAHDMLRATPGLP
jgi:dihydroflavonol-4-reductase